MPPAGAKAPRKDWQQVLPPSTIKTRQQTLASREASREASRPKTPPRAQRRSSAPPTPTPRLIREPAVSFDLEPSSPDEPDSPIRPRGRSRSRSRPEPTAQTRAQYDQQAQNAGGSGLIGAAAERAIAFYTQVRAVAAQLDGIMAPLLEEFPEEAEALNNGLAAFLRGVAHPGVPSGPGTWATTSGTGTGASRQTGSTYASVVYGSSGYSLGAPSTTSSGQGTRTQAPGPGPFPHNPLGTGKKRVMVRLPADHPLRASGSHAARTAANACPETKNLFSDAIPVPTGFALIARDPTSAAAAIAAADVLQKELKATKVEPEERWTPYLLGPVPRRLRGVMGLSEGGTEVTPEMIISEILLQTGTEPRKAAWTRRSEPSLPEGEVTVYFKTPDQGIGIGVPRIPPRVRIFGQPAQLRPISKHRRQPVCEKCFGFHNQAACHRSPKCGKCGSARHEGACATGPRCLNCRGPHPSTQSDCPARPTIRHGVLTRPNKAQIQAIRTAGSRAWATAISPTPTSTPALTTATATVIAAPSVQLQRAPDIPQPPPTNAN
jgi:hypothetical protein